MNEKQFRLCKMFVGIVIGVAIGWSVAVGEFFVPIAVVAIGLVLMHLCKSRVTEVMEDELVHRLSEKASLYGVAGFALADGGPWCRVHRTE